MPCDTVATAAIELGKVDRDHLSKAMTALGFDQWGLTRDGKLTIRGANASDSLTASVKQAYSKQVILSQAKRFGWKVSEKENGQLMVQKQRL